MTKSEKQLKKIVQDAYSKRSDLVQKYKKQGKGNVSINLIGGFTYTYGETIKTPQIVNKGGYQTDDWELFNRFIF